MIKSDSFYQALKHGKSLDYVADGFQMGIFDQFETGQSIYKNEPKFTFIDLFAGNYLNKTSLYYVLKNFLDKFYERFHQILRQKRIFLLNLKRLNESHRYPPKRDFFQCFRK
jgi:hypothetical protein